MSCDSNERGVSSPFYLLSLQQKLVVYFYNGVCKCDSIQKESLLSPDVANPAEDLFRHSPAFHPLLYGGGRNEHSAEKQLATTQPLTLTRQRHKLGMDIPLRGFRLRCTTP